MGLSYKSYLCCVGGFWSNVSSEGITNVPSLTEAEMCIHADARTVAAECNSGTKAMELRKDYMIRGSRSRLEGQMSKTTLIAAAVVFVILGAAWYFLIR